MQPGAVVEAAGMEATMESPLREEGVEQTVAVAVVDAAALAEGAMPEAIRLVTARLGAAGAVGRLSPR